MLRINTRTYLTFFALSILAPYSLQAAEGVDVSFAVQAIQIHDIIKSQLSPKANWSLVAVDLETGKRLVDAKETRNYFLLPGSLMKLFVTAALLDRNAADPVSLDTVIALKGRVDGEKLVGDVIIKGGGNALLSSEDLLAGIERIKSLGIERITGNVIVDNSLFDARGWKGKYKGAAYSVPSALGLDLHTVSISFDASKREDVIDPPNNAVKVRYITGGKQEIRQMNDYFYEVSGVGSDRPALRKRFSLADPSAYAGGSFVTLLKREGIVLSGKVRPGRLPAEAREIALIAGPSIHVLVRETNMQSLNVAADNMLLLLGASVFGAPGTREKGIRAVKRFLKGLGVPPVGLRIEDGSGLSGKNRVTAEQLTAFLQLVSKKPWFPFFYGSLSRPGMDGRMRDFSYRSEHIRVKSGQLPEAYCLAGYIDRIDGRKIAFSYLMNGNGLDVLVAGSTSAEVLRHLEGK